jgi:fucokinase
VGKLFARIPRTLPDGRASTVFDEFLISLSGMAAVLPPGALVASGDVLLVFDHLQLSFRRQGVTGVAAYAPAEMGARHGVFVTEPETNRLRAYLHKPGDEELARWDAVENGRVQIDTGLVWLDGETVRRFTALANDPTVAAAPLNLYGDLLLPLAGSTEAEGYFSGPSDAPATAAVRAAREVLWPKLRGIPLTVEQLQPAVFVHFGSSREYYEMAAVDRGLAELCGWEARAAAWPPAAEDDRSRLILVNSSAGAASDAGSRGALLVADSDLGGRVTWEGAGIISGVHTAQPLHLPEGTILDQLPLTGAGIATRVYGIGDDPKRGLDDPEATFCNRPWGEWLAAAGVSAEDVWPHVKTGRRTLWDARVFPLSGKGSLCEGDEGLLQALWLATPETAPVGWREQWLAPERVSLAESARGADGDRLLARLVGLEDAIAARRFCAGVLAEEPAAELKCCLCTTPAVAPRRAVAAAALLEDEPWEVRLRGLCALTEATGDASWEDRAFGLLAEKIEAATPHDTAAGTRGAPDGGVTPDGANVSGSRRRRASTSAGAGQIRHPTASNAGARY